MKKIFPIITLATAITLVGCQGSSTMNADKKTEETKVENPMENENQVSESVAKELEIEKPVKTKEEKEEEKVSATGKYIERTYYNSKVHIYITGEDETVKIGFGKEGELERLSEIELPKEVAKINLSPYREGKEQLGMLYMDGELKQKPDERHSEFIKTKKDQLTVHSFKKDKFDTINEKNDRMNAEQKLLKKADFIATGTNPLIIEGEINTGNAIEFESYNKKVPRTMFGQRADGRFLLVVVDGNNKESSGVTVEEAANIMADLNAIEAINLDGGGSSAMYVDAELKSTMSSGERSIGNALIVVKKDGEDDQNED